MNQIDFQNKIPKYAKDVAETLQSNGYEAFLVGGSVRDLLLGKEPEDYDIATNAYPDEVSRIFKKSIPTGAKFGTITVIAEDSQGEKYDVQVTTYRSEADYVGGRWPSKVEFARTIEEDLSRRDFTINAIALSLQTSGASNQLIDPYDGIKDLEKKIIRAVRDPMERFSEDGLRSVRACRLASQLQFSIEEKTFSAIKQTLHITKLVSVERFREELMKLLLKSPKPSVGLRLMKDSGILQLFIPELLEGVGIFQPQYHADDVFEHSVMAVDEAEDSIKLVALLHDIGKPRTRMEDERGIHFYGHDVKGSEMVREIMKRLKFPNIEIERTSKLVRWHMFYYPSADWRADAENSNELGASDYEYNAYEARARHGWTDGAIRRLIQNVGGEEAIDDLLKLRIADQLSNKKYEFNQEELDSLSQRIAEVRAKDMALKITDLDITGEDLINEFGLTPGKELGEILKYLLEKILDEPLLNKRSELIELAREYLKKQ